MIGVASEESHLQLARVPSQLTLSSSRQIERLHAARRSEDFAQHYRVTQTFRACKPCSERGAAHRSIFRPSSDWPRRFLTHLVDILHLELGSSAFRRWPFARWLGEYRCLTRG